MLGSPLHQMENSNNRKSPNERDLMDSSRKVSGLWTNVKWREVAEVGPNSNSPSPQLALPGANSPPSSISAPSSNEESSLASELSSAAADSLPLAADPSSGNPPSSVQSSSSSNGSGGKVLSADSEKNLRSFLRAIDQCRLAQPIFAWEKLKVLSWLGQNQNQQNGKGQSEDEVGHNSLRQIPIGHYDQFYGLPSALRHFKE